ncbi:hypothetical protein HKCCSP123_13815 [Rhodobacterales bacterium HKCCSP123]|nr:hypothetical protein [Rhodobacterales bacterium HKCCSP123]
MNFRRHAVAGISFIVALGLGFLIAQEAVADEAVRDTQQILRNLGYDPGPIDGAWGSRTASALRAFSVDSGIEFNGTLTTDLYEIISVEYADMLTNRRSLEAALSSLPVSLFPIENEACFGGGFRTNETPVYYETVDRNVHGTLRIGGFIQSMGQALAAHIGDRSRNNHIYQTGGSDERFQRFLSHLEQAAEENAFTRLYFTPGGGPNPAHWVSALMNNLSYLVNYADRVQLWRDEDQREEIVSWGNRLYDTSHLVSGPGSGRAIESVRWPDTVGMQALGYVNWGLATGNLDALSEGIEDWFFLFELLESDGAMRTFLNGGQWQNVGGRANNDFYYDNALGFMVMAAVSARSAGIDLFQQINEGANLHDAVRWRFQYVTDWESLDRLTSEPVYDAYEGRRRYWQADSFGGNWGWTEAYIYAFSESDLASDLREQNALLLSRRPYVSVTMGPSSCLYGLNR